MLSPKEIVAVGALVFFYVVCIGYIGYKIYRDFKDPLP